MTRPLLLFLLLTFTSSFSQETVLEHSIDSATKQAEGYLKVLQQHYANGDYELHKNYSDSLLLVSEKHGLTKMHILALNNQAVYHNNRSEKQFAIERYHLALEKCKLIPEDYRTKAIVLINMGNTYYRIDAQDKAIASMKEALLIVDKIEKPDAVKAAALLGISNSYNKLGNLEPALEYAEQVRKIGEKLKNESYIAKALTNTGDIYIRLKQYDEALQATTTALQLSVLQKPTKSRGWALLNRGIANYRLGNFTTAEKDLLECAVLSKEKDITEVEMYAHEYLAMVYEVKKDFKASYAEQKEFSILKKKYENDTKKATKKDVDKSTEAQNKKIATSEQELAVLSESSNKLKVWGGGVLLLTVVFLVLLLIRRKKTEKEQTKLRAQYKALLASIEAKETSSTASSQINKKIVVSTPKPYENSSLTKADRVQYKNKILAYIKTEKPYLNADLTQTDFAAKIGISSHHFSEVLHYGFEQNFYNFINSYRVVQAQYLIKDSVHENTKMIAIAFDSGFKNKASFNRAFKKHTGLTPSEYKNTL